MTIYDKDLKITGEYGIVGRSVVIHADEDDLGKVELRMVKLLIKKE